ncbi:MAG: hypothetical protein ABS939_09325 [Psychrobacillus sp.]
MMKANLITLKQAQELKALGFHDEVSHYVIPTIPNIPIRERVPYDHNSLRSWLSIPTCDEVIDWLRRKYDVCIYTSIPPFVDPTDDTHPILYRYAVKFCNKRDGWNGRVRVGETNLSKNVYAIKRQAIWLAIRWIKANKKPKVSMGKVGHK